MEAIVLPLTYFGNVAYFRHFVSDKKLWIDDHEPYLKQTYRNRMRILGANGPLELSVPIKSTRGKTLPIDQIEISYDENWPLKQWRSIKSAYKSSPFYEEYEEDIKVLIFSEPIYLVELNKSIVDQMIILLGIEKDYHLSSEHLLPSEFKDRRTYYKPSKSPEFEYVKPYQQVFNYKFDFVPNLSILDLLFNEGPYSKTILNEML